VVEEAEALFLPSLSLEVLVEVVQVVLEQQELLEMIQRLIQTKEPLEEME
jgi:hypothetical protein